MSNCITILKARVLSLTYHAFANKFFVYNEEIIALSNEAVNYNPGYDEVISDKPGNYYFSFLEEQFIVIHNNLTLQNALVIADYGSVFFGRRLVLRSLLDSYGYFTKSGLIRYIIFPWHRRKAQYISGTYFHLAGNMNYNYFHFLIDSLPRIIDFLELKREMPLLKLLVNFNRKFTLPYLNACGVKDEDVFFVNQNIIAENLIMSNNKFTRHCISKFWAHHVYSFRYLKGLRELLFRNLDKPSNFRSRIYISREDVNQRVVKNEVELMGCLENFGFKKILLGNLSVLEQVALFRDSEFIIGAHGAGFSNIIFSQNAVLIEIFPKGRSLATLYQMHQLGQLGNNRHILYECDNVSEAQDITLDVDAFIKVLSEEMNI